MMIMMVMMVMAWDHYKLELWEDDDGIDNRQPHYIVIDNTVLIKQDQKTEVVNRCDKSPLMSMS